MSRDFTPIERYISNEESGDDLWLHNFQFVNPKTGESMGCMFTDEEQALRMNHKVLAVTMSDAFLRLYKALPEEKREARLAELEGMLSALLERCKNNRNLRVEYPALPFPETLKKWLIGKLDPGFYYSEENDRMFLDWCLGNTLE